MKSSWSERGKHVASSIHPNQGVSSGPGLADRTENAHLLLMALLRGRPGGPGAEGERDESPFDCGFGFSRVDVHSYAGGGGAHPFRGRDDGFGFLY
jgi:hypothetical protein